MSRRDGFVQHPLLAERGVEHGFGTRAARAPDDLRRPHQVHGIAVVRVTAPRAPGSALGDADAVVSDAPGVPVGVVTADCLPVLLATPSGWVAAIHAGWRGLAAGVIAAACEALRPLASDLSEAVAVIGPHVGACCYEVDAPVVDALAQRFGARLDGALRPAGSGHWRLALAPLARVDLERAGLAASSMGALPNACTRCDAARFHSFRRDGAGAGRLVHYVRAPLQRLDTAGAPA